MARRLCDHGLIGNMSQALQAFIVAVVAVAGAGTIFRAGLQAKAL